MTSRTQMDRDVVFQAVQRVVPAETTRHGLVIGINRYADVRLNLRCAVADACALRDLMVDPECGCFPADNVQLLVDEDATTERIFRALANLRRQATEKDTVWIYYAGHAAVEAGSYWVTHDADVDDLFATALSSDRINSVLAQLRTRRVLYILDCCHAETAALMKNPTRHAPVSNELLARFEGHGIITLAASSGTERSVELPDVGHGAFTYFLAKGLRGEADSNKDGVVTADELWAYLRGKVATASGRAGNVQTPMLIGSMTHDLALTLSPAGTAKRCRLMNEIEGLVGLRADQLSTDEGRLCADIVLRGARTDMERLLLEALEELGDEKLTSGQFRRLLQVARLTMQARDPHAAASAVAEAEANEATVEDPGDTVLLRRVDSSAFRKTLPLPAQDSPGQPLPGEAPPLAMLEPRRASARDQKAPSDRNSVTPRRQENWRIAYIAVASCWIAIAGAVGLKNTTVNDLATDLAGGVGSSQAECEPGGQRGCVELALAYDTGRGVTRDAAKAAALYQKACDSEDLRGCTRLGLAYDAGRGVGRDVARAAGLYRKACDGGDTRGCNQLGAAYSKGRGVVRDVAKAATLYQRACNDGHMQGCTNLGLAYEEGRGVARDAAKAATLYQQACGGGDMYGCICLGSAYYSGRGVARDAAKAEALDRQAAPALQRGCDDGEMRDCAILGFAYAYGRGVARDPAKAANLYLQACDGGDMRGCRGLGMAYETGAGMARDLDNAATFYLQACDGGDMFGCESLGAAYANGRGVARDLSKAATLYLQACNGGSMRGCASLGFAFETGAGVPRDVDRAATLYQQACDASDMLGCANLGLAYANGRGVTHDFVKAATLYQQACDGGNIHGCAYLGFAYEKGDGVERDLAKAAALYQQACAGEDVFGCFNLGVAYANGRGVERDLTKAATLYQKACDGAQILGCNNLGVAYEYGHGVEPDATRAATLYQKACDGGTMRGCANLGDAYSNGRGVERAPSRAATLYRKACDGGITDACERVKPAK